MWFSKEKKQNRETAMRLYNAVAAQARLPVFYAEHGVPDTVTGRFEMFVLHAFLIWNRLDGEGDSGRNLGQALFDVMFRDMDRALRNIGIGDLGVPHHIRRMMKGCKGRAMAYRDALCVADEEGVLMRDALRRNLFGTVQAPDQAHLDFFVDYINRSAGHLAAQDLRGGDVDFMKIEDRHERQIRRAA